MATQNEGNEVVDVDTHIEDATPTVEELQAELALARAEAAKHKNIRKTMEQERNDWKKKAQGAQEGQSKDEEYKTLWETERAEKEQLVGKIKATAVENALLAKLTKVGVPSEALDAARKLVDRSMIEWDPEDGVDSSSVDAAVSLMKKDYGFLFEKKVNRSTPKLPADSSSGDTTKTINRDDYEKLSQPERRQLIKQKVQIVD